MKNLHKIIILICFISLGLSLTSCGRYSAPMPVEGSGYPHNYPHN